MQSRQILPELTRRWHDRSLLPYIRVLVVVAVIFAASLQSAWIDDRLRMLVIAGIIGVAVVAWGFGKVSQWGVMLMVLASLMVPFAIGTGSQSAINAAMLSAGGLTVLWLAQSIIGKRRLDLLPTGANLPLLILSIAAILGFLAGQLNWYSFADPAPLRAQLGGTGIFVLSAMAFWYSANNLTSKKSLQWLTYIFLAVAGAYMLLRIIPGGRERILYPLFPIGADASMYWLWIAVLATSMGLFNTSLSKFWRGVMLAITAMTFFVAFTQAYDWKSGWVPAVIGLAAVVWLGLPKLRIPAILAAVAVAIFINEELTGLISGGEDYSILTRWEAWVIVAKIAGQNPLLGLGPANYYWYTPQYPILGYSVSFNSHNNYLDIFAQVGLLGLGAVLAFFAVMGIEGWRGLHREQDPFQRAFLIAGLGGLVGVIVASMLGDWFLPFVYNVGFAGFRSSILAWIFLGGMTAVVFNFGQPRPSDTESAAPAK